MTVTKLAIAATGLCMLQGIAAASAADFGNARIAVIVKATTSQYWATVFDGADAAAKTLGVQISKLGATAETDVAGEVSIVENAISAKPTAIVIAATNAAALARPIEQATAAGIPVIVIDFECEHRQVRDFSGHQQRDGRGEGGRRTGRLREGTKRQGGRQGCLSDRGGGSTIAERSRQGICRSAQGLSGSDDRRTSHRQ